MRGALDALFGAGLLRARARAGARARTAPEDARTRSAARTPALAAPYLASALALALCSCIQNPAPTPSTLPVLAWPTLLGDVRRAGHAGQEPPDSPRIAWSEGVGRGLLAPPVVAPPMLFIGTSNRMVVAISTENAHTYWERHVDGAVGHAVVAGGGRIYAASEERDGVVYALEEAHGRVQWKRKLGFAAAAPLLLGDTLVVALEDRRVLALSTANGEQRWSAQLPAPAVGTPVPWRAQLLVAARNDSVYALGRGDGRILARAPLGGFASAPPALAGDTLVVPLEAGGVVALELPALTRLFRAGGQAPVLAPPALASDGTLWFLDSSADLWKLPPGASAAVKVASPGGAARGSLTLTAGGLLVGRLDGRLALVRFDGSTAWSTMLDGSIAAPAAVVAGEAYVPLEGGRIVKIR